MRDKVFYPSDFLTPYIKCYWTCRHDEDVVEVMYPSGCLEMCIDISTNDTIRYRAGRPIKVPTLEILGHWNVPTRAALTKGNTCLITRFQPYAAPLFFPNPASDFTNESIDLRDIFSRESAELYSRLMEQPYLEQKIEVLEAFLFQRLLNNRKAHDKMRLVEGVCNAIGRNDGSFNSKDLAKQFGFSERYIQKLFLNWVGITPKDLFSIHRFNKSLHLIRSANASLTAIAYECGYYDQAHFIREFKSFTGLTPSQVARM